jgi:hypothetical protein
MDKFRDVKKTCFFIGWNDSEYSRSSVLLNYHSSCLDKIFKEIPLGIVNQIRDIRRLGEMTNRNSIIVIMSPCHKLAILARIFTKSRIVLDAGWPLTDGVLSRGVSITKIFRLLYNFSLDFLAFHSSHIVLVETNVQKNRVSKIFLLRKNRIERTFTGFNEIVKEIDIKPSSLVKEVKSLISQAPLKLIVIFRGKINSESGFENIVNAARLLKNDFIFLLATSGTGEVEKVDTNCIIIPRITRSEMSELYEISNIALGQISMHPRLKYTIPHKAFEAGYFGKCFVSADSVGIQEWLSPEDVYLVEDMSPDGIAESLKVLKNQQIREMFSNSIKAKYQVNASQRSINQEFEAILSRCFK